MPISKAISSLLNTMALKNKSRSSLVSSLQKDSWKISVNKTPMFLEWPSTILHASSILKSIIFLSQAIQISQRTFLRPNLFWTNSSFKIWANRSSQVWISSSWMRETPILASSLQTRLVSAFNLLSRQPRSPCSQKIRQIQKTLLSKVVSL